MKNILILIILSNLTYSIHAQNGASSDNFVQQYDRNTIYLKKGGFEKDGQITRYGFLKKNLKKELTASPLALQAYKRSRTNHWLAVSSTIAGIALQVSGVQRIAFKKEIAYSGLGFNLLAIPLKSKSKHQLDRAIWLYNRDAIAPK